MNEQLVKPPPVHVTIQIPPEMRAEALKTVWMSGAQSGAMWGVLAGLVIGLLLAWTQRRAT